MDWWLEEHLLGADAEMARHLRLTCPARRPPAHADPTRPVTYWTAPVRGRSSPFGGHSGFPTLPLAHHWLLRTEPPPRLPTLYESLFEHSADGVLLTRTDGSILRANPAACRALCMSEAEVLRGARGLVVSDEAWPRAMLAERRRRAPRRELRFRRGDGTAFPVELTSALIPGPGGGRHGCSIFRDITDRMRTEEALRESEERFRIAFQTSPDSLSLNRLGDGAYLAVNEGFTQLTGWSASEVLGRTPLDIEVWDDAADRKRLIVALRGDDCRPEPGGEVPRADRGGFARPPLGAGDHAARREAGPLHDPRHHQPEASRGGSRPAPGLPSSNVQDGGHRSARRRGGPRLQQPAHGDPELRPSR